MKHEDVFRDYLKHLHTIFRQGDASEPSFYPALKAMLETFAQSSGRKHVFVTVLPKSTEAGNPDFRLWNGKDRIIGYIEAKSPTEERLDEIEESEQVKRYRSTFPNLILTNFLEFRLYRDGNRIDTVVAARPLILTRLRAVPVVEKSAELYALLDRFMDFSLPKSFTVESLAVELAKRTRFLRDVVAQVLEQESDTSDEVGKPLTGFFNAFQKYLIATLTPEDFADLFAQTITYGLFAARIRSENSFNRRTASDTIPHTIGVLRDLFRFISIGELPEQLAWCVDDIAEVLAAADARGILDHYFREHKGSDPIVHFYETFLAQYDPEERERRGVYYTPEPVVDYIVRSVHEILKTEFEKSDGLASDGVKLLDPGAGTMTFVAHAAQQAVREFESKYGAGGIADLIRGHILKNFHAFELMMAPYAVGHLKMSFLLEELGYRLAPDERVPFYLTNALEMEELAQSDMPFYHSLAEESRLAARVKKHEPILVILGNPPYSGHSANLSEKRVEIKKGQPYIIGWNPRPGGGAQPVTRKATRDLCTRQPTFIGGLIRDYFFVDEAPLGEKNPKWLQDDYVKFIRFAQWKIEKEGRGVVGIITNHSYLDNPTFRGMRHSLMRTFDKIYVLDLHGNSLKKETCPDGSKDENVFDIRQGVAIAFFIKTGGDKKNHAVVQHADLWGLRQSKYDWLKNNNYKGTQWRKIQPCSPLYLFVPRDTRLETCYRAFIGIDEIFPINSVGIVTARDHLTIQWSPDEAWKTVTVFCRMDPELARQAHALGRDVRDWKVTLAQKDLRDSGPIRDKVVPILYRPFDVRYTYYTGRSRGFHCMPRPEVMQHMIVGQNLALLTHRREELDVDWGHAFVTDLITEHGVLSSKTTSYHFPLFIHPTAEERRSRTNPGSGVGSPILFETGASYHTRRPNLNPALVTQLAKAYGEEPSPEKIFHYIYAVLYAPSYRRRYAEFLRMDFPRIPFCEDQEVFSRLATMGERLVELHLLKSPELDPPLCRFEGQGDGVIGKGKEGLRHDSTQERVYINAGQYFAPVPESVWKYQIGGYQVCEKWLKVRMERKLDHDDIRTYCRIVTALQHTIRLQQEIDEVYSEAERNIVAIAPNHQHDGESTS